MRTLALLALAASATMAQTVAPPVDLKIEDMPGDNGGAVSVTWKRMPYDAEATYVVEAAIAKDGPWYPAGESAGTDGWTSDHPWPFWTWSKGREEHFIKIEGYVGPDGQKPLMPEEDSETKVRAATPDYWFRMTVKTGGGSWTSEPVQVTPKGNLFDPAKLNTFLYMGGFAAAVMAFIQIARKRQLWIRRIPGLDAVEEAVGRATEMGRPIYYLTGRNGMTDVSTVAATLILGEIAKKVAAYDTTLKVPHTDAIVMAVCQEITREAYIAAGRPDSFRAESNFFVTDDQFGYTAAVDGMMVREKPAACLYMGYYYAESLLLAETGASTGAIQIAGTDADHQLPFFFTACDYTLIGEELYAAGAYLSREPVLVGTLRSQDVGKAIILGAIVLLTLLSTCGQWGGLGMSRFVDGVLDLMRPF